MDSVIAVNASSLSLHTFMSAVPENVIIAFGILILSYIKPETQSLPFYGRHIGFPVERNVSQC